MKKFNLRTAEGDALLGLSQAFRGKHLPQGSSPLQAANSARTFVGHKKDIKLQRPEKTKKDYTVTIEMDSTDSTLISDDFRRPWLACLPSMTLRFQLDRKHLTSKYIKLKLKCNKNGVNQDESEPQMQKLSKFSQSGPQNLSWRTVAWKPNHSDIVQEIPGIQCSTLEHQNMEHDYD